MADMTTAVESLVYDPEVSILIAGKIYLKPTTILKAKEAIKVHSDGGCSLASLALVLAGMGVILYDKDGVGRYQIHAPSVAPDIAQPVLHTVTSPCIEIDMDEL